MKRRGVSLGTTLLLVLVLVVLVFSLAAGSVSHLNLANLHSNSEKAHNLAVSVISMSIATLREDPAFGRGGPLDALLELHPAPGSDAWLAFHQGRAGSLGIGYSTNNLDGDGAVDGWNSQRVPARSVHLVGVGRHAGVTKRVEAVLHIPQFPYAVATSGPVHSLGGLVVGGLPRDYWSSGSGTLRPDELVAADLVSNAPAADAVTLGADTLITGDLQSAGGVALDPATKVQGEVRTFSPPAELPEIELTDFDPASKPENQLLSNGTYEAPVFGGFLKHVGNMTVTGGMELDSALLYVEGNLSVTGGLKGVGALIVTGTTSISGGATELTTDNAVAILSGGDILLTGGDQATDLLRGIVYTEGTFYANQVTLVGTLVARGDQPSTLNQARVVFDPEANRFTVTPRPPPTDFSLGIRGGVHNGLDDFNGTGSYAPSTIVVNYQPAGPGMVSIGGGPPLSYDDAANQIMAGLPGQVPTHDLGRMLRNAMMRASAASTSTTPAMSASVLTVNLSEFLNQGDAFRVLLWKDWDTDDL